MSENCNHDCGSCSQNCEERDLHAQLNAYSSIKKVVAVSSGKGGVGKSSVTAMLAVYMARRGYKVGNFGCGHHRPLHPQGVRYHPQGQGQ